jgi:hypothetical protein
MFPHKRWLWCLVLCTSAMASAQGAKPVVMPFPLELKRVAPGVSKDDKEALQREYQRLLRLAGAQLPDFVRADTALKELKRQDCEREDECLVQLAKKAEALYGLYVSLDYTLEGSLVAVGRVVRDDGKVSSAPQTVKLAKGRDAYKDIARNALSQLFLQLKVSELPATRPVEVKVEPTPALVKDPVVVKEPPPPPPPLVIEDTGAGQRSAGKALVYVGAGVAVIGGIVAAVGAGVAPASATTPLNGKVYANTPGDAQQLRTASSLATSGLIAVGVGALTAGVGAVLWGTAAPPPKTTMTVVPMVNGAVVQLGGTF